MGKRFRKRVCAVFVSAVLAAGQLPLVTLAENILQEEGVIVSFEPLDSEVAVQTVMMGTELSELDLPDKLKVVIYPSAKDGMNLAEDILGKMRQKRRNRMTNYRRPLPAMHTKAWTAATGQ